MNKDGTNDLQLVSAGVGPFAVDASYVYWIDEPMIMVMRANKDGTGDGTLASWVWTTPGKSPPDGTNVYWAGEGTGVMFKCAIGGCGGAPTQLATGLNGPQCTWPSTRRASSGPPPA